MQSFNATLIEAAIGAVLGLLILIALITFFRKRPPDDQS